MLATWLLSVSEKVNVLSGKFEEHIHEHRK